MDRAVDAEVLASTFDEPPSRHVQVADMAMERARRMVEQGRDVVVFLDSLSRLARAYNAASASGVRELHGAVDLHAIHLASRTFGTGRACEEGGSLTMIATAITGSASPVDAVLLDELEGAANVELFYDAGLAAHGKRPAIDPVLSHSRDAEHLFTPDEYAARGGLRDALSGNAAERHATLSARIGSTPSNDALWSSES